MLSLEISLLNSGDCETVETELAAIYSVMERNSLNSLILSTYTIKFSLIENIEALLASKFSFRFWRMLPVWLRNVERMMYGYEVIGSAEIYLLDCSNPTSQSTETSTASSTESVVSTTSSQVPPITSEVSMNSL